MTRSTKSAARRGTEYMRNITITDGTSTVTLLSDIEFTISPEFVGTTATMASGKTVRDIVGVKNTLTVPTGWLSAADLSLLRRMIYKSHILTVTYPDLDGDKTAEFFVTPPEFKSFKYGADGVEQWYGVTLKMEQYGTEAVTNE